MCELILTNGSDLKESEPSNQATALHSAALRGHESLLRVLLSHKADVDSRTRTGFTPLHLASQEGRLASVVTLLHVGADPLLPDRNGALPIHLAAKENDPEVVRILIEEGGCSPDQVRHTALQSLLFSVLISSLAKSAIDLDITHQQNHPPPHHHRNHYLLAAQH